MTTPLLAIRDLHAAYGKIEALKGVDLDIKPGEIVALIGANGAGKSTLMMSVFGRSSASRGRVPAGSNSTDAISPGCRRTRSRGCGSRSRRKAAGFFHA
jgi:ABC-type branched-subunit amino acid transport system ATPase component